MQQKLREEARYLSTNVSHVHVHVCVSGWVGGVGEEGRERGGGERERERENVADMLINVI